MIYILKSKRQTALGILYTYDGYNARLSVRKLVDGGAPISKLEHKDVINAPNAVFNTANGQVELMLDFHNLCIPEEAWVRVRAAADEMLSLWREYLKSEDSVH